MKELRLIRTEADYEKALAEVERGSKRGTPKGDRLDVLATLIEEYEAKHYGDAGHETEPIKVLGTRPTGKKVDHSTLIKRTIKRYPKTLARLAK
jgi:antitoxin component HigA of HigAB toxin-antitoxin module